MEVKLAPGKYVVAVSGGVDSIVLLDVLSKLADTELFVAHFDHGTRPDSQDDRRFVEQVAKKYGLPFAYAEGQLGIGASEALAREKRYAFLRKIKQQTSAKAIVTAHHQDDLVETALLNMIRGTGRRGLSSLRSTTEIKRPLLAIPKQELYAYARQHSLSWREDPTNQDDTILRNYIRHQLVPKLSPVVRKQLLKLIADTVKRNKVIDSLLERQIGAHATQQTLHRQWFMSLPHAVAREVLLRWLQEAGVTDLNRRHIERLTVLIKTLAHGKLVNVKAGARLEIGKNQLALKTLER